MSYRIVLRPDKNLGVFNDATDTWVDQSLSDEDAADLLSDAERIDPAEAAKMIGQLRAGRLGKEYDGYVMTWAEAEWRTGGRHGNRPLARDANGMRILAHGTGGWRRGCKCAVCTEAHLEDNRKRYDTAADRDLTHGLSGYAQGCKCEVCTAAKAANERAQRGNPRSTPRVPRLDPADVRDQAMTLLASERERALITELAVEDGMATSAWIMERLLPELAERKGYEDVRRPAPRRPNYNPPAGTGGQQQ